jgi:hypothetical protein
MSEYKDEDVVLVGWPTSAGEPAVPSTEVNCCKCGQSVWVSSGSMNTVLDKKVETGGELYIVCLMCAPDPGDTENHEIQLGEEQKEEMLRAGLDIEEFMRKSGLNLTQIAKLVVERAQAMEELRSLHRAANPRGCGSVRCSVCNPQEVQ